MRSITGLFLIAVIAVPAAVYQISEMTSFKLHTLESEATSKIMTVTVDEEVNRNAAKNEGEQGSDKNVNARQEMEEEKQILRVGRKSASLEPVAYKDESSVAQTPLQIINQMPMEAWLEIKGIGQVTAERILTFRNEKGGFTSLDALLEVKGIGPAKYAAIMEWVKQHNKIED